MQLTQKQRSEIALALPELGLAEARQIGTQCECSHDTVYREWNKIKGKVTGKVDDTNPVVVCLAELAARRAKEAAALQKRMSKSMKQLSIVKAA
jgi:hypothetical protein